MTIFKNDNTSEAFRSIMEDLMDCDSPEDLDVFFTQINQGIWLTDQNLIRCNLKGVQKAMCCMSLAMSYLIRECHLTPAHILEMASYFEQTNRTVSEQLDGKKH